MTINVDLIREKIGGLAFIPKELVDVSESTQSDFNADDYIVRIFVREYHERLSEIEYPADWWQAFKERWLTWLPFVKVRYKRFALDAVYPEYVPHEPLGRMLPTIMPLEEE